MRRAALALMLIAGAACSKESVEAPPPPRPAAQTSTVQPEKPAAWSVSVRTSGGFSGHGKGSVSVRSDGEVTACGAQRLAVENAIATARPESWQRSYNLPEPSGMTDQFSYSLSLTVEQEKGEPVTHETAWKDESVRTLPADLRTIYDTVWAVKQCP